MTWAQRLKRVFNIDIETCPSCGGAVRTIACIEDPEVIEKILTHWPAGFLHQIGRLWWPGTERFALANHDAQGARTPRG